MKNGIKFGIGALIILALVIAFFLFGGGSASVISSDNLEVVDGVEMEKRIVTPFVCETSDTCEDSLLSSGAITPKYLAEAKLNYDIICENNVCVGVLK